ncbi:MAG: hypothetical protein HYY18_00040 [Planctomycetes bacterium]|nr:hypothetical protein [Planctomycetota bacterium]
MTGPLRPLAVAFLAALPGLTGAEEPARLFWKFQEGQSIHIELKTLRETTSESGGMKHTLRTEFAIVAELNIREAEEIDWNGTEPAKLPAKGEILFTSILGSVRSGDEPAKEVKETEESLKDSKVAFTIATDGRLEADEKALAKIHAHLPPCFAGLFILIPRREIKPGETWTEEGTPVSWNHKYDSVAEVDGRRIATFTAEARDGKAAGSLSACKAHGVSRMTFDIAAGYAPSVSFVLDASWVNDDGGGASTKVNTHEENTLKVVRRMR